MYLFIDYSLYLLRLLFVTLQVDLMVSGDQPVQAMAYISDLLLFWVVFSLPPEIESPASEGDDRYVGCYVIHHPILF